MVAVRNLAVVFALLTALSLRSHGRPESKSTDARDTLFAQSAAEALNHDFPKPDISYLLLDARSGQVLAARWEHPELPIPLGSLAKPFAALAYGEQHGFHYPNHFCKGTATGCWRPDGHGDVDLTSAIAYSCNSYFRVLTADMQAADVSQTANRFGIDAPDLTVAGAELAGLGPRWRISPLGMAHAYLELARQPQNAAVKQILGGMARSAREGTGAEVDRELLFSDAMVKTGTAACTHPRHAPGDGFTIALVPSADPKLLLMVRVHGVPGSHAARTAGQMLRRIGE